MQLRASGLRWLVRSGIAASGIVHWIWAGYAARPVACLAMGSPKSRVHT